METQLLIGIFFVPPFFVSPTPQFPRKGMETILGRGCLRFLLESQSPTPQFPRKGMETDKLALSSRSLPSNTPIPRKGMETKYPGPNTSNWVLSPTPQFPARGWKQFY